MKKIYLILLFPIIFVIFIFPLLINAQVEPVEIENPLKYDTFEDLINAFINFIFWVGIAIAPIMILIAGFNFLTAGGDPKKVDTAKKIILYTVIGLAIVLLAKGLIGIIKQILGVETPST